MKSLARWFVILLVLYCSPGLLKGQSCPSCEQPSLWQCEQWDPVQCLCLYINPGSPILIDLTGSGLKLTSAADGVRFDIRGTGIPIQIAWTSPGAEAAFLALDENQNGRIDNGKELFGNFTNQPPSSHPNGFLALAEFDTLERGGNLDGVIDVKDRIYGSLKLWIDMNHNGISEMNELYVLPARGVTSISLSYRSAARRDRFGNRFLYRAKVTTTQPTYKAGPWAYDVFFVTTDVSPIGNADVVGAIDGGKKPGSIPDEIVYGMFLRIAACPANATPLQQKKCSLARSSVGLSADNDAVLKRHLQYFLAEITPIDRQVAALTTINGEPQYSRMELVAKRNQAVRDRVASLRAALPIDGARQLAEHIQSMKSKIKFIPRGRSTP